jgi:lipoprotein-releasing system permease protein
VYKLHLILKYLRKRRIAWVSLLAVTLCVAMVLVVISVMGGWLRMFRDGFHGITGDIVITSRSLAGFGDYEKIIAAVEAMPEVAAAVPVIRSWGLINIDNVIIEGVAVVGVPIDRIGLVNEFPASLYRQYQKPVEDGQTPPKPSFDLLPDINYDELRPRGSRYPGMIVGAGLVRIGKDAEGKVRRPAGLYTAWARLEVLGVSQDSVSLADAPPKARLYWIVDDSRTKLWQFDQRSVYVPFHLLQEDLDMAPRIERDAVTGKPVEVPGRTTEIQVRVKDGFDPRQVVQKMKLVVSDVTGEQLFPAGRLRVETWEEAQSLWLNAIEKEVVLVTMLFGIISLVAVFLIFVIFYMIVVEKTRDIGIIKSVGATSGGVAGIFLGYGLAIGVVGSALGLLISWLIVRNINYLHEQMGKLMGVTIWDPQVYQFDTIPNTMNPSTVAWILLFAVVASLLGAVVPAWRAARLNPVEALRFE